LRATRFRWLPGKRTCLGWIDISGGKAPRETQVTMCRVPEQGRCACTFCWAPSQRGSLKLLPVYLVWHCLDRQMSLSGVSCPVERQGHLQEPRTHNSTVARQGKARPGLWFWYLTGSVFKWFLSASWISLPQVVDGLLAA
jgi:hypothetical protein